MVSLDAAQDSVFGDSYTIDGSEAFDGILDEYTGDFDGVLNTYRSFEVNTNALPDGVAIQNGISILTVVNTGATFIIWKSILSKDKYVMEIR